MEKKTDFREWLAAGGILFLFLALSSVRVRWMIAASDYPGRTGIITTLILIIMLAELFLVIWSHRFRRKSPSFARYRSLVRGWLASFLCALLLMVSLIVVVDPLKQFGTGIFLPYVVAARTDKAIAYRDLAAAPDVLILGSSRSFTLSPEYIRRQTGLTAFNFSVEAGWSEDYLIQTTFAWAANADAPRVLLVEVTPSMDSGQVIAAQSSPLFLIPYMPADTSFMTIQRQADLVFDIQTVSQSLYTLARYVAKGTPTRQWNFSADGTGARAPTADLAQAVAQDIATSIVPNCREMPARVVENIEQIIRIAEENSAAVIFHISPSEPRFQAHLDQEPAYHYCYGVLVRYMESLTQAHDGVYFLDLSHLESVTSLGEVGFYDGVHLTPLASERVIDALRATLLRAAQRVRSTR